MGNQIDAFLDHYNACAECKDHNLCPVRVELLDQAVRAQARADVGHACPDVEEDHDGR
mgnify:CR=1 FL=1